MKKEKNTRRNHDRIQMQYIKLRYKENTCKKKNNMELQEKGKKFSVMRAEISQIIENKENNGNDRDKANKGY